MEHENGPADHPTRELGDDELLRDLDPLYRLRLTTLRHGAAGALEASTRRIGELEQEYLRRRPEREIDPARVRPSS